APHTRGRHSSPTRRSSDLQPQRLVATREDAEHFSGAMPGREVVSKHKAPGTLLQDAKQIPEVLRIRLDGRSRTQKNVIGASCNRSEEHTSELQSRENLVCR